MIRSLLVVAALAVGLCGFNSFTSAEDAKGKEEKLTGTMVCGKCALNEGTKCSNVLQVKKDDKVVFLRPCRYEGA